MMVRKLFVVLSLMLAVSMLVSCNSSGVVSSDKACTVDSDCVAALCCHSDESVNRDNAPNCAGVLCSAECVPGTLDCGLAKARCVENACTVVLVN